MSPEQMADHWWWRPGWRAGRRMYTWHVTFDGQPAIHDLAAKYQSRLAGLPGLDPVPAEWLHLTTQGVGFTDEIPDRDVAAIIDATSERLASLSPIDAMLGPVTVTPEAILLDVAPLSPLRGLRDELRAAISDVLGPEMLMESADWTPHVSVAYSNSAVPAAEYISAVADSRNTEGALIDHVQLIVLGRDRRMYEWSTRAEVPVGTELTASPADGSSVWSGEDRPYLDRHRGSALNTDATLQAARSMCHAGHGGRQAMISTFPVSR
jgi:2'-5' RNA ligase